MPGVYEYLEAERIKYAIRLPANPVLQNRIGYLLKRPVGRPPHEVRRYYANFSYQAASWTKPRRVVAKVEWHPGELYPRVGFIVTNMSRPAERVVAFYNKRGTAEQWIREGKGAIKWTRLSCRTFAANAVRLQLHALAYNLFLRTLATLEPIKDWSLTSLKDKLIKIGEKVVSHGRYIAFQMAEIRNPSTNVPGDFAADCRTAAEASARASVRQPMVMRSRTPDGGSTPRREAKPDTSAPTTPGRARIASDRPPTRTALPGSPESRYDAPQIRCSSGESQRKLARWWLI
jgi:hypothetical protein